MSILSTLKNTHRPKKKVQRVGRGVGSGRGKTCCRGYKGDKSRRGYKKRYGNEGGQLPLYKKLPEKGFTNGRFKNFVHAINLSLIEKIFSDGDVVNLQTLRAKGYAPREVLGGLKILSFGQIKKKVRIEAHSFSKEAIEKLHKQQIPFVKLEKTST